MDKFKDYFNNLNSFVFKKEIISDISKIYNVVLTNDDYTLLIKKFLAENIIAKSSNTGGRCAYISKSFLDKNKLDAISYYKSQKIESHNTTAFTKKSISFECDYDENEIIQQISLTEVFNEL